MKFQVLFETCVIPAKRKCKQQEQKPDTYVQATLYRKPLHLAQYLCVRE